MAKNIILISGAQGTGKSNLFKVITRSILKAQPSTSIFAFDGEGRRMNADDRKKAAKSDVLIVTRQTYKRRAKSTGKNKRKN